MDGIDKLGGAGDLARVRMTTMTAAPATPAVSSERAESSSAVQALALLADASAPVDAGKVEAIRSLIAAGAYPIDARAVAAKMVALDFPASGDGTDA